MPQQSAADRRGVAALRGGQQQPSADDAGPATGTQSARPRMPCEVRMWCCGRNSATRTCCVVRPTGSGFFEQTGSSYAWNSLLNGQKDGRSQGVRDAVRSARHSGVLRQGGLPRRARAGQGGELPLRRRAIKNLLTIEGTDPKMIELRNVRKKFGTRLAVDDLTLDRAARAKSSGCSATTARARARPSA